jgi:hypothetical protein
LCRVCASLTSPTLSLFVSIPPTLEVQKIPNLGYFLLQVTLGS